MISKNFLNNNNRHRIKLLLILCLFGFCLVQAMQSPKKRAHRPHGDRVYLLHADELKYDMFGNNPDAQIVKARFRFFIRERILLATVPIFIKTPIR